MEHSGPLGESYVPQNQSLQQLLLEVKQAKEEIQSLH